MDAYSRTGLTWTIKDLISISGFLDVKDLKIRLQIILALFAILLQ